MVDRLQTALGKAPAGREPLDGCGAGNIETVQWNSGLGTFFQDGRFAGWTAIDQRTAEGIGFGSSRADVVAAYHPAITNQALGEVFSAGGLHGVFESADDDAQVSAFWAGMACMQQ